MQSRPLVNRGDELSIITTCARCTVTPKFRARVVVESSFVPASITIKIPSVTRLLEWTKVVRVFEIHTSVAYMTEDRGGTALLPIAVENRRSRARFLRFN